MFGWVEIYDPEDPPWSPRETEEDNMCQGSLAVYEDTVVIDGLKVPERVALKVQSGWELGVGWENW